MLVINAATAAKLLRLAAVALIFYLFYISVCRLKLSSRIHYYGWNRRMKAVSASKHKNKDNKNYNPQTIIIKKVAKTIHLKASHNIKRFCFLFYKYIPEITLVSEASTFSVFAS